ncbi:hypothetical protein [Chengkuizengella axinellae]|uniref:Uncharacterized protein n=1 Tax=Chengkuizengella axinellae TaxID=3064388 RepID=A0ABT9ITI5_9BACL|nr:hypothetical protein [Chengkuizengella sp. 2205SS18-9]MDP5272664.1 hypothetical protein [Chengkuizengella sp. 2205SS18-9]
MGLKDEPFVVIDTVSVVGNIYGSGGDLIFLEPNDPTTVATVDVCVKQPEKTQVCIDSMVQFAVGGTGGVGSDVTFQVLYEIHRNGDVIARINDEMDFELAGGRGQTNFPNFPVVDNDPIGGINTYDLVCTRDTTNENAVAVINAASRSLKATVITL